MWTIGFDSLCEGFVAIMEDDQPVTFATEAEAIDEMDTDPEFYVDCFPMPLADIGHKAIFTGR